MNVIQMRQYEEHYPLCHIVVKYINSINLIIMQRNKDGIPLTAKVSIVSGMMSYNSVDMPFDQAQEYYEMVLERLCLEGQR
jgi:hypothetical protein